MSDEFYRVTILAIGVWKYQKLRQLTGPEKDLQNISDIFLKNPKIAIFQKSQYRELRNPKSHELRDEINQYVYERGAENDILIFYFSGHGAPIGTNNFGFCTADTITLPGERVILPMSAVSVIEILNTLQLKKVIPIFLIDACYSGAAGGALITESSILINNLKDEIEKKYASSYALLCSAPNDQEVMDNPNGNGGVFSDSLVKLAESGIDSSNRRSTNITLEKLYPFLRKKTEQNSFGNTPVLFLGSTLPDFSIFKNIYYRPLEYKLYPHLIDVLMAMWNDGNLKELKPKEIEEVTKSKGAYGNYTKLSYGPWRLIEKSGQRRKLSKRGISFMKGELKIPSEIVRDEQTDEYIAKPGSNYIGIDNFRELK